MFVYVLDYWEKDGRTYKGTRPWCGWYSDAVPGEWESEGSFKVRPLRAAFRTPAVVIVHWAYLVSVCGLDAERQLHEFSRCGSNPYIIVVSGGSLPKSGVQDRLYFRAAEVGDKIDDPFRDYLCEFLAALERDPTTPDFQLLDPEPTPTALMDAETAIILDGEFPAALSAEARRQCLRIIARGDGRTPMRGAEVDWLKQADWPSSFLVDDAARRRFIDAIAAVRAALSARRGARMGS